MVMQRLERAGRLVRCALLPAPREAADPWEGQCPYGGLRGLALVAVRRGVPLGPAGMPDRRRRPCDPRVPEAVGTREAPVPPGRLAAPCGHRGHPGLLWAVGG